MHLDEKHKDLTPFGQNHIKIKEYDFFKGKKWILGALIKIK